MSLRLETQSLWNLSKGYSCNAARGASCRPRLENLSTEQDLFEELEAPEADHAVVGAEGAAVRACAKTRSGWHRSKSGGDIGNTCGSPLVAIGASASSCPAIGQLMEVAFSARRFDLEAIYQNYLFGVFGRWLHVLLDKERSSWACLS